MSFTINLQINSSPLEQLDKNISTIVSLTGTLKEDTSIINPIIKIQGDLSSIASCNYMTIPKFNRSYIITDIRSITNNIIEISGHVDVLSTYRDQIRNNAAIIRRQENDWNLYLNDGSFKVYQNPMVLTRTFPSGFTTQEFVLAIAGS